ncbi:MAG: pantoate--beta-alanine ligase [Chloroflexi bacterium]|nr:pantoate--beta-alanine ligase [Chloroflexota bacterium]
MKVIRNVADLGAAMDPAPGRAPSVGLVPTMGSLHAGHLSLMAAARAECDVVVVSLFVNPAQFGRGEDLEQYPRDEVGDIATAESAGVDLLFAPAADQVYPEGFDTWVDPGKIGAYLEGSARPGHFRGVATICTKLFLLVKPRRAYFGRKDAQQVAVVKQLVRDLELPVEIVACPTVRDPDGLAMSSRNAYLSPDDRQVALALPRALEAGLAAHRSGTDAVRAARDVLDAQPGLRVDYVAEADLDGPTLAAAVVVGSTRLIDNVVLDAEA